MKSASVGDRVFVGGHGARVATVRKISVWGLPDGTDAVKLDIRFDNESLDRCVGAEHVTLLSQSNPR